MRELDGPEIYDIVVSPDARVVPQVKFGRPNEDMDPLLQRKNFQKYDYSTTARFKIA